MLGCACCFPRFGPRPAPLKDLADRRHHAIRVRPSLITVKDFAYTQMLCLHVNSLLPLNVGHAEVTMPPTKDLPSAWPANCTTAQTVFCRGNCHYGIEVESSCNIPP